MTTKKDLAETLEIYEVELLNMEGWVRREFANPPNEDVVGLLLSLKNAQEKMIILRKILLSGKIRK